jgi:hypothetical protein
MIHLGVSYCVRDITRILDLIFNIEGYERILAKKIQSGDLAVRCFILSTVFILADRKTLLADESAKEPCKRFLRNGECVFGSNCRFTHFTRQQLEDLRYQSK